METLSPNHKAIPEQVKRLVRRRSNNRCEYVDKDGRCDNTNGLSYHHLKHRKDGGENTVRNLLYICGFHRRLIHLKSDGCRAFAIVKKNNLYHESLKCPIVREAKKDEREYKITHIARMKGNLARLNGKWYSPCGCVTNNVEKKDAKGT